MASMQANDQHTPPASNVEGAFRPRRLTHFNLEVADLDTSASFYHDVAGFEIAYERPLIMSKFFSNGSSYHDLALMDTNGSMGSGNGTSLHHLAFELENEVELVSGYESALASGVEFVSTASHDVAHSVYLHDPDGNGVEIYADVVQEWRQVSSGVIKSAKKGWVPGDTPPVEEACYPHDPEIMSVANAVFHPRRTASACLIAAHYEAMFRFYSDVVGLTAVVGGVDSPFVVFAGSLGEPNLSIFRSTDGRRHGLHHVGLEVGNESEFEHGMQALAERGLTYSLQIRNRCRRVAQVRDPDGIRLHFYVDYAPYLPSIGELDADAALLLA